MQIKLHLHDMAINHFCVEILISKAFYFRSCSKVAVNFVLLKPINKDFIYV